MRNIFLATVGLLALLAAGAVAGDYHYKSTLNCPDCHVMHASQQHGYNTDGTGFFNPPNSTPQPRLLRDEVTKLCLGCHNNQTFAPDVVGPNGGTIPPNGRQAGALNGGANAPAPYYDATGHTLGSTDVAPGGTFSDATGLTCPDCHTVHGSANYRNARVRGFSSAVITYAVGTNDLTKDVFERSTGIANHYDTYNVDFNEPNTAGSAYATFCKACHTDFHGTAANSNMDANMYDMVDSAWVRHPTAEVDIPLSSTRNGTTSAARFATVSYRTKVMSPTGDWGTQGTPLGMASTLTNLTPSCFSCHKGHGSANAFGLIYATGAAPLGENGDGSSFKQTCQQCHSQGI